MSLPENCEQYQKFGYDNSLMLEPFRDKLEFLEFLDLTPPKLVPNVLSRGKESFLDFANEVAKFIKDQPGEHYLLMYLAFLPT